MSIQRVAALLIVIAGAALLIKTLAATWLLLILVGAGLALAANSGMIGKWGYGAAAIAVVAAVPGFFFSFALKGLGLAFSLIKAMPFLLVILGIYWLFKAK